MPPCRRVASASSVDHIFEIAVAQNICDCRKHQFHASARIMAPYRQNMSVPSIPHDVGNGLLLRRCAVTRDPPLSYPRRVRVARQHRCIEVR